MPDDSYEEPRYDARGAAIVRKIERALYEPLPLSIEFGALANALEAHIEIGHGDPEIVRGFENLYRTMANTRAIPADEIARVHALFETLVKYLENRKERVRKSR